MLKRVGKAQSVQVSHHGDAAETTLRQFPTTLAAKHGLQAVALGSDSARHWPRRRAASRQFIDVAQSLLWVYLSSSPHQFHHRSLLPCLGV